MAAPTDLELLEWAKVGVSILTPMAITFLTFVASRALNERSSQLRKGEQLLTEKQRAYATLGEDLNIIYVFIQDVGDFRRYTPDEIIARKRDADRKFYMYRPFWSDDTAARYRAFMESAFLTFTGSGRNAQIRSADYEKRAAYTADDRAWKDNWTDCFTGARDPNVARRYDALVAALLDDVITLDLAGRPRSTG